MRQRPVPNSRGEGKRASHEIERVAEESTSGREDGQCAHRGDKQAKASPLNVSTAYLLNIFFGPASAVQRFNGSRDRRLNVKCRARECFRSLDATLSRPMSAFQLSLSNKCQMHRCDPGLSFPSPVTRLPSRTGIRDSQSAFLLSFRSNPILSLVGT